MSLIAKLAFLQDMIKKTNTISSSLVQQDCLLNELENNNLGEIVVEHLNFLNTITDLFRYLSSVEKILFNFIRLDRISRVFTIHKKNRNARDLT